MADVEFAFLADAADARPGRKFAVIGGGVSRLGGPTFPFRHPHLALVIGLAVTGEEVGRQHELRFMVLTPDGTEMASAQATVVAGGPERSRDSVLTFALDLWNLAFPVPGDYRIRILIDGEERKWLPLRVEQLQATSRRSRAGAGGPMQSATPERSDRSEQTDPRDRVKPPFPPPTGKA